MTIKQVSTSDVYSGVGLNSHTPNHKSSILSCLVSVNFLGTRINP